jgi:uncharacterized protein with von Willebrand factor type A (vWA) domain
MVRLEDWSGPDRRSCSAHVSSPANRDRDPARARARSVGSPRAADRAAHAGAPRVALAEGARRRREPRRTPTAAQRSSSTRPRLRHRRVTPAKRPGWAAVRWSRSNPAVGSKMIFAPSSYSPLDADAADAPELPRVERAWRDAARSFVRRLHLGLSRRWRPATQERRFDLRRTLRAGLQTGGEALSPRWLRRPRRAPRFVLLVDGSRSMSAHARTALQMAVAMASATMRMKDASGLARLSRTVRVRA